MTTNYLVLIDFTNSASNALKSALNLARSNGGNVFALHVLTADDKAEHSKAKQKMENLKADIPGTYSTEVRKGKLDKEMNSAIESHDIDFVIMGTHGVVGIQKVLGAKSLKLVSAAKKPFLVTQENRELKTIKSIVLPFSYSSESVQIGKIVALLAQTYKAKIYLVGYRHNDEWLKNDMVRNQAVMKRALSEYDAEFEIIKLEGKASSYEKDLVAFANSISADLIAAAHFSGSRLSIRKNFVRDLITNEFKIPVLTINAECMKNVGNHNSV